mmetsp:Transcript_97607/g.176334  ORF Transcript_97607/g.176334 Transcript_97607/m.176334 type:complete len:161 (+) Transcript_97607:572-1054(+)
MCLSQTSNSSGAVVLANIILLISSDDPNDLCVPPCPSGLAPDFLPPALLAPDLFPFGPLAIPICNGDGSLAIVSRSGRFASAALASTVFRRSRRLPHFRCNSAATAVPEASQQPLSAKRSSLGSEANGVCSNGSASFDGHRPRNCPCYVQKLIPGELAAA